MVGSSLPSRDPCTTPVASSRVLQSKSPGTSRPLAGAPLGSLPAWRRASGWDHHQAGVEIAAISRLKAVAAAHSRKTATPMAVRCGGGTGFEANVVKGASSHEGLAKLGLGKGAGVCSVDSHRVPMPTCSASSPSWRVLTYVDGLALCAPLPCICSCPCAHVHVVRLMCGWGWRWLRVHACQSLSLVCCCCVKRRGVSHEVTYCLACGIPLA
jgi:hypothetical protein